jgi:hypothetical protein
MPLAGRGCGQLSRTTRLERIERDMSITDTIVLLVIRMEVISSV